jgi:hypothetical protein
MAELVPAIHAFVFCDKDVDARHEAGHDGEEALPEQLGTT